MKDKRYLMRANGASLLSGLLLAILTVSPASAAPRSPARYAEGELLIKFRGGPRGAPAEHARGRMKHEVQGNFDTLGWQHIRLPRGLNVEAAVTEYRKLPGVLAVEPNLAGFLVEPVFAPEIVAAAAGAPGTIPNDPLFNQQFALARIGATNAWRYSTGNSN